MPQRHVAHRLALGDLLDPLRELRLLVRTDRRRHLSVDVAQQLLHHAAGLLHGLLGMAVVHQPVDFIALLREPARVESVRHRQPA